MPRRVLTALLVLPLALAADLACAAAIHGDVTLPKGRSARVRDAVVWLEQVPDKVERRLVSGGRRWIWRRTRPPRSAATVVEVGLHFDPRVLAVAAGDAVVFRNADTVWHGAFSMTKGSGFELGKRAPGSVDTVRFEKPGVIALRCDIHPAMSAYVVVTPNHAFVHPEADGYWRLPDVPAGTYVVHAWYPDLSEMERQVRMPARGDTLVQLRW